MNLIPSKIHGMLDYLYGVLLIAAPWLFGFYDGGAETWIPVIIGVMVLLQSIMTDYELGLIKVIPLHMHLRLDFLVGLFLGISPWLFFFDEKVWVPHVLFGAISVIVPLLSRPVPDHIRQHTHPTRP